MCGVTSLSRRDWRRLLDQLDSPPVGQVAEALADAHDLAVSEAYDIVEAELASGRGPLVEDTDGGGRGASFAFATGTPAPKPMRRTRPPPLTPRKRDRNPPKDRPWPLHGAKSTFRLPRARRGRPHRSTATSGCVARVGRHHTRRGPTPTPRLSAPIATTTLQRPARSMTTMRVQVGFRGEPPVRPR